MILTTTNKSNIKVPPAETQSESEERSVFFYQAVHGKMKSVLEDFHIILT